MPSLAPESIELLDFQREMLNAQSGVGAISPSLAEFRDLPADTRIRVTATDYNPKFSDPKFYVDRQGVIRPGAPPTPVAEVSIGDWTPGEDFYDAGIPTDANDPTPRFTQRHRT